MLLSAADAERKRVLARLHVPPCEDAASSEAPYPALAAFVRGKGKLEGIAILSGLVLVKKDRIALLRTSEFKSSADVREALQAGPFSVDAGKAVVGLDETRSAAGTIVFANDTRNFGLLTCQSATLAGTARILSTPGLLPAGKITRALNLDGGSSTALRVKREPFPFYSREWKGVRNYLAITPRK